MGSGVLNNYGHVVRSWWYRKDCKNLLQGCKDLHPELSPMYKLRNVKFSGRKYRFHFHSLLVVLRYAQRQFSENVRY